MESENVSSETVYHLRQTIEALKGPQRELIIVNNNWAAVGLNRYHNNSKVRIEFSIDGQQQIASLNWDSNFSDAAMKETKDIANHGAVGIAWFVMSVILDYSFVEQTHIGDGVDYLFKKSEPNDDDLNFLENHHYVEISGILEESGSNTLKKRVKEKHEQINKGGMSNESSSVIVTLFSKPITIKEIHK